MVELWHGRSYWEKGGGGFDNNLGIVLAFYRDTYNKQRGSTFNRLTSTFEHQ